MKLIARQKIWLTIVIGANLALWLIPSDVVEQIARDRHTLLGRYSRTHFAWILGVMIMSPVTFYIDWSTGKEYRRRWFTVLAVMLAATPVIGLIDFLVRSPESQHYRQDGLAYHRPPEMEFQVNFEDKPQAYRTYPDAPPGYGTVQCRARTDVRGFRNTTDLDRYDVVVLGDSFAEGSKVSDEQNWPVRLADASGLAVYNLGMSGYAPLHYLESLERYGLPLSPRLVLCMLYEGNDFRSAKSDRKQKKPSLSKRLRRYFKQSPIVSRIDHLLIENLGPINCASQVRGVELLDWLPLTVPDGPEGKRYAFAPKQLRDLYQSADSFEVDRHWLNPRGQLAAMNDLCRKAGCRLLVLYAPTKAHVTLPIVSSRLPARKVRDFTAISFKGDLPGAKDFLANLLGRADARQTVVGKWCRRESIEFFALTDALQKAALEGRQVYYTYDQHWTPDGHDVVADAIRARLHTWLEPAAQDSSSK